MPRWRGEGKTLMNEIRLSERLYKEAERRAQAAGYATVDDFVAEQLQGDFSAEHEDCDDRFTPDVIACLDRISDEMKAGRSLSMEVVDKHQEAVRAAWLT